MIAAPIQSPVNVSRAAKGVTVGDGGKAVDSMGIAVGAAQADSTQSRRRVVMMRMMVSICE
jgi:hypothetical protein